MMGGDEMRRHLGARLPAGGRQIDQAYRHAFGSDDIAHIAQLAALGVEGAGHQHHLLTQRRQRPELDLLGGAGAHRCGGLGARGGLDAAHRHRRAPARRRPGVGDVDAARALAAGSRCLFAAAGIGKQCLFVRRAMAAHPQQRLLQFAITRQARGVHDAVDAAIDHDRHLVGDGGGNADVLLDHQDVDIAFLAQLDEHVGQLRDDDRGQALGRLVHDQQTGIEQKGAGDGQHLLLAAGQLAAVVAPSLGQAREGRVDAIDGPGALVAVGHHPQMFVDVQRAPQAAALRHIADAQARDLGRRAVGDGVAGEHDAAGGDRHQPHDGVAQRGLAHAVAPDHRQDAALQAKIDALQGVRGAVVDVEPRNIERGGRAVLVPLSHGRSLRRDKAPAPAGRPRSRPGGLP